MGYSVMDELLAMEAKIFKNGIFSVENYNEVQYNTNIS